MPKTSRLRNRRIDCETIDDVEKIVWLAAADKQSQPLPSLVALPSARPAAERDKDRNLPTYLPKAVKTRDANCLAKARSLQSMSEGLHVITAKLPLLDLF